jgi:tetratricopeptide (TPR) repeat protein
MGGLPALRALGPFFLGILVLFPAAGFASVRSSPQDSLRRVADLRKLVHDDRLDLESRRELADLLGRSRDIEVRREAYQALHEALLIDASDPDLWIRMARLQEVRGFRQSAKKAYHRALDMAPDRSDLWSELAQHEFRRFQERKRREVLDDAVKANQRALEGDPENPGALRRAVRIAAVQGDWAAVDSLEIRWGAAAPDAAWPHLVRGMLYTDVGAWRQARDAFQAGLERMTPKERKPFRRLDIVDPKMEDERRHAAPDTMRFFGDYWRWRDPTPADPLNPRLLEHYARMVKAELLFGLDDLGVRGWDHAPGEMIVRYGIDRDWVYDRNVHRLDEYRVSATFAAPSIEVSFGRADDPLRFMFVDYNMSGRYFNPIEPKPRDEDYFLVSHPSQYVPPLGMPEFPQEMEILRFMDGEGNGSIEVSVALAPDAWPPEMLDEPHRLASKLTQYDERWAIGDAAVGSWASFDRDVLGRLVGRFRMKGSVDSLIVGLETMDRRKAGRGAGFETLGPRAPGGAPTLSDLAFLTGVTFDGAGGVYERDYGAGIPNPGHRYRPGDPVGLAFEAYDLETDADGRNRVRLHITVGRQTRSGWFNMLVGRGQDPPQAELVFEVSEAGTRLPQTLALDVPDLDAGGYELRVRVEDLVGGTAAVRSAPFTVLDSGSVR